MRSIRQQLIKTISIILSVVLFVIFLVVDISLDSWVEEQFNHSLEQKANYLKNLVDEDDGVIEFDFSAQFMPEFSAQLNQEYFQLWSNDSTVEKSDSFKHLPDVNLPRLDLMINTSTIVDTVLPNGRDGRVIITHFLPQAGDSGEMQMQTATYLSVAMPTKDLSQLTIIVDISLILSFMLAIFAVRYFVSKIVTKGLRPLLELNEQIKNLDITKANALLEVGESRVEEIEPIRRELNSFIKNNKRLIENEQRLTSDIAHEIKTPISEIISLTEMSIKYPDEVRINKTYKQDVLASSTRLNNIVHKMLLLHQAASQELAINEEPVEIINAIENTCSSLSFKYPAQVAQIIITNPDNLTTMFVDKFCFETVLNNLLDNAFFYAADHSPVRVELSQLSAFRLQIAVTNQCDKGMSQLELTSLFEPFYQLEKSRTHSGRHGLGLSIIKKLSDLANYNISIEYNNNVVSFSFDVQLLND
ncbi:MAG: HAMP domain-containing histidine kinase [Gammaproteobacteria bacterium]|nr:HAMP domain-containing histidine kinase [Gammaproteobacteria bacterium]